MDSAIVHIFRTAGFQWGATGKEDRAIQCIFSFVADISKELLASS